MTATLRKQHERQRRKERGEVEYKGWLSASDHAALTQMAREAGLTQAQVVGRLIGMVGAVLSVPVVATWEATQIGREERQEGRGVDWVRHSDLTAAVVL